MKAGIISSVSWSSKGISRQGETLFVPAQSTDPLSVYKALDMNYPKFYKMDLLSQLGVVLAQLLVGNPSSEEKDTHTGVVLSSNDGCLDTDEKFQASVAPQDFFPSPALFVYTLPNIVSGELCIRYKWQGENIFLMTAKPDAVLLYENIQVQLQEYGMKRVVAGWLNAAHGQYQGVLLLVEATDKNGVECTEAAIQSLVKELE